MTDEEATRWHKRVDAMNYAIEHHIDPKIMTDFFERLAKDWNSTSIRFCWTCEKFVSKDQAFWNRRDAIYTY